MSNTWVLMDHPDTIGYQWVTQEAFTQVWAPLGWVSLGTEETAPPPPMGGPTPSEAGPFPRWSIDPVTGKIEWGSGTAPFDTNLYRSNVSVLTTDDLLFAGGGFQTGSLISGPYHVSQNNTGSYIEMNGANALVQQRNPASVPLVVRGAAAQSAPSFEIQDSAFTNLFTVDANGLVYLRRMYAANPTALTPLLLSNVTGDAVEKFEINADGTIWWGSGSALRDTRLRRHPSGAGVEITGTLSATGSMSTSGLVQTQFVTSVDNAGSYLWLPGSYAMIQQRNPAEVALVVKGAPAQSTHLQAWTNSADAVQAYMSPAGMFSPKKIYIADTTFPEIQFHEGGSGGQVRISGDGPGNAYIDAGHHNAAGGATFIRTSNAYLTRATFGDSSPANVGLKLYGMPSQSADVQQWINNGGSVLGAVDAFGGINISYVQNIPETGAYVYLGGGSVVEVIQRNPAAPPLAIRQAAAQSTYNTIWQDSASNLIAAVEQTGGIRAPYIQSQNAAAGYISFPGISVEVIQRDPAAVALVVNGAASQTSPLQEWRNSLGAALAFVDSAGGIAVPYITDTGYTGAYLNTNVGGSLIATGRNGAAQVLIVRGAAVQTGDPQQWQTSGGGILAKLDIEGNLHVGDRIKALGSFLVINGPPAGGGIYIGEEADTEPFYIRRKMSIIDSKNIAFSYSSGTKIGEDAAQKFAFWGANPIVRPTGVPVTAAGIHAALVNIGLIAA